MGTNRIEAFSDGVLAIIITIMVLELKIPEGQGVDALLLVLPTFLSYILSFVYVGIYWNNHHHLLHTLHKVTGPVLWANLHLLFWLSLVPFASGWMGANPDATVPAALYGVVLLMASIAYNVLQKLIINTEGVSSMLKQAIGNDTKGKISMLAYMTASALAIIRPWIAQGLYVILALLWLIPDKRIEKMLYSTEKDGKSIK
ncbi:MAG TPA: TMEM175 family protein [Trichococcus sp.]|nr:TMEM175 family protein [Trichococcus sp.]